MDYKTYWRQIFAINGRKMGMLYRPVNRLINSTNLLQYSKGEVQGIRDMPYNFQPMLV